MSNIGAADSWENQADVIGEQGAKDSNDVSTKFSTLNVNAVEFVPSFCMPSQANETSESPHHHKNLKAVLRILLIVPS